jgi:hypothetical protein
MRPSAEASPWSLVEGFADCLRGAHLFQIEAAGVRALIAVRGVQMEAGRLLDVVGMRSLGDRAPAPLVLPVIEHLARETYQADLLSMCTRHPHLVRACERQGWSNVAAIVNKPLRLQ